MAIRFSRDAQTGAFEITNTVTNETRKFDTQAEFSAACLLELLRRNEEMQAGLARLEASYERRSPAEVAS